MPIDMQENVLVSVIMSVYNGEAYLKEAVFSVLGQTYENFEFIIIDDGSTDRSAEILKSFQDSRLKIISRINCGLTKSLNYAIKISQGELICRLDADDYFESSKIAIQVNYLKNNPDVALCGTWAKFIDEKGCEIGEYRVPVEPDQIKKNILFHNPFIHSSVMFRKAVINNEGGYNEEYRYAQDYELWGRLVPKYKVANIPEFLVKYRKLNSSITRSKNFTVRWLGLKIRLAILFRFLFVKLN